MTDNKRDSGRLPVSATVRGEVTVYQPMTILDLSARGARIETTFALHLDSLHDLRLTLGERSVIVKGRIAHSEIADIADDGVVRYRTGLEFVEPSGHALRAIRAFVELQAAALRADPPAIIDADVSDDS